MTGADAARLTVWFSDRAFERYQELAAEVVRRAHTAGLPSATVRRGGASLQPSGIPAPRSVSLADAESVTVCVVGSEEQLRGFAATLDDLGRANVCLEFAGRVRELHKRGNATLRG